MNDTMTAKVFKSGNSQAVRLPKDVRFGGKTVQLVRMGGNVMLVESNPKVLARRRAAMRKLWGSCPDFPAVR